MTIELTQLWAPVCLGAVLAWISSALIHMLVKYHNNDYKALANEDAVASTINDGKPQPGLYSLPYCIDPGEMANESMQKKFTDGPVAFITVFETGLPNMGKLLAQQISYFLVGTLLIGFCASLALPAGADYMSVFKYVSAVGFLTFGWALIPFSIWYGHPWSNTVRYLIDALIYGLIVAGSFAWLWPGVI